MKISRNKRGPTSIETRARQSTSHKQRYVDNPELRQNRSEHAKARKGNVPLKTRSKLSQTTSDYWRLRREYENSLSIDDVKIALTTLSMKEVALKFKTSVSAIKRMLKP